ncbi:NADP-dependent malic enzyme [Blomia tropicalis]|nr:NADP-dependent malic enzyme [Blomia tropicalis]
MSKIKVTQGILRAVSATKFIDGFSVSIAYQPKRTLFNFLDYSKRISLKGRHLIRDPDTNKGLAFTEEERQKYRLQGLLPAGVHNQAHQAKLVIDQIREFRKDLNKYIYLRDLQDYNKHLFYRVLQMYPDELMPIVYTPVVGLACLHYSRIYKRPRGLFVTINDAGNVDTLFKNWDDSGIRAIVVTDGERILGLGDQGAHGMGISVGKMALYTAIGGIPPSLTLPVCLDVGTNNEELLNDPYYIGLHKKRTTGPEYDALIDEFMQCVVKRYGINCLIQFEDFGNANARRLLERYRHNYCTFNDDIQGTASVTLAGIFSFNRITGMTVSQHTFLFQGAGTAALGIADLIVEQMIHEGLSEQAAHDRIWMRDIEGLVTKSRANPPKYAKDTKDIFELEGIVRHIKPTCIIGVSAQTGAFTKEILAYMAEINPRPLILSLSNPTSKSECTAEEAYRFTNGQCLFASGSPFGIVYIGNKRFEPSQGNNAYIFPAMALSIMACGAKVVNDQAFIRAAMSLAAQVTQAELNDGRLYPSLGKIHDVTREIAADLCNYFYEEKLATFMPEPLDKYSFLKSHQYEPIYDQSFKKPA